MKKNIFSALMALLMLVSSVAFVACDGEDLSTNQFKERVSLLAFGPSPVARGGELRIIGTGLSKVTSVVLPGCGEVTDINVINDEEIRIMVPQNAEPGKIAIKTASQTFESVSVISYTEPVGFAESNSFAPNPVKAGQKLTIKGEYLNLVQAVIFAGGVEVPVENPARPEISVIVPAEAQSGKVAISFCATGDTIPNTIYSNEELKVVLPSVEEIANLTGKKPGDEIKQTGADFDLIEKVTVAGQEIRFTVDGDVITYTLPENTPAEAVVSVYPASGIEVVIATIGMQLPTDVKVAPSTSIWAGDNLTITGKDLDVVTNITFPGVADAVKPSAQSATAMTVTVPAGAQSGKLVLNLKSGISVEIEEVKTLKPLLEAYNPDPVAANGELEIKGSNLNTVAKVQFEGVDPVEVTPSATSIVLTVPTMATSGAVKMLMSNGESVDFAKLTINSPECAFITDPSLLISTEDYPMYAGDLISFVIENADKYTGVKIDGAECQTIIKGNIVYVVTPDNAGLKSVLTLVSSNGEIDYPLSVLPNSEIVTTLWSGAAELGWSGDGQVYLGNDGGEDLIAAEAKAGDIIRIKLVPTADDWQVQIWEGHWGTQYDEIKADNYDLSGNGGYYNITLTDELLATFTNKQWWGGIILTQGQSCIVTALELVQTVSMEETIWTGSAAAGGWASGMGDLSWGGYDWSQIAAGKTLRVYFSIDPAAEYDPAIRLGNGSWVALPTTKVAYADRCDGDGNISCSDLQSVEIKLTADDLDQLINSGGLVVCGAWFIVTKICIE